MGVTPAGPRRTAAASPTTGTVSPTTGTVSLVGERPASPGNDHPDPVGGSGSASKSDQAPGSMINAIWAERYGSLTGLSGTCSLRRLPAAPVLTIGLTHEPDQGNPPPASCADDRGGGECHTVVHG